MPTTLTRALDTTARLQWLPAWVLAVGLLLTLALGSWSFDRESDQRSSLLQREAREAARLLEYRVQIYLDTLPGLRVYGMLQEAPTDAEFLNYVQSISLQTHYPGLAITFVAELVDEARRIPFETRARLDDSVKPEGRPGFTVRPPGPREQYMVLRHAYPENAPSLGYDLYDPSENYRQEVERALSTGSYVATRPLQLARDRHKPRDPALTAIVVRAALYRGGLTPATEAERRQRATGVVGIGFRVQPLVQSVLLPHLAQTLRLRVLDEQALDGPEQGVLFDSTPGSPVDAAPSLWQGRIRVADRTWTLSAHDHGGVLAGQESTGVLLLFGAGLSLALAALTRALVRANLKSQQQQQATAAELLKERDQLQHSEARFRMLFEHSFDAVLRTHPDGLVLEANAAAGQLFGGEPEALRGLARDRLVDISDPRLPPLVEERRRRGRAAGVLRMRRLDGRMFEAEIASALYTDSEGQACASIIVRDVTEGQRLAQRLQEKQRLEAIGTLAGGVAHDFNNMLAAILGNTALAEKELPPGSPALERLQLVQRAGQRARQLVRQVLTFGRRAPREQAVQPLQPLVDEALALLRATMPPTVRLKPQATAEPLWVLVDGAQVQQMVLNLVTNAWQALPDEAGEVRVVLERCTLLAGEARVLGLTPGDFACLRVEDDGHGMDASVRERIFEPFFTTKPAGRGTGLGLPVVHGVVVENGGALRVESEPGRGARFSVFLPLAGAAAVALAQAVEPTAAPVRAASGRLQAHLLYVDDDEVVALTAEALLSGAGHRVQRAPSGEAALHALGQAHPPFDLVITDFNMPGLSGLAVAEAVLRAAPGTPIIVTSGLVTDELQQRARALGVQEVLPKEDMLEHLADAVQRALARRAQRT